MNLTIYSLVMAIVWFDVFVLIGYILQRNLGLFLNYNFYPIVILVALSVVRLVAPVETPLTTVIRSEVILPAIQTALKTVVFHYKWGVVTTASIVVFIASIVSVAMLIRLFRVWWKEYQIVRSLPETADRRLLELMSPIAKKNKPKQPYKICVIDINLSPSISGLRNPVIILPKAILTLSNRDIQYILMHEWQHFLDKDLWIKLFIQIICCIMWWNPVVYLLKKNINQTFELKCDWKTTNRLSEEGRLDYLSTLISVARMQQQITHKVTQEQAVAIHFTGSAASKDKGTNEHQRFQTVLKHSKRNRKIEIISITCLLLLFITSFRFVVQPAFAPMRGDFQELDDVPQSIVDQVTLTPENAWILERTDGTYWICTNGETRELRREELNSKTYENLSIIKQKEE